jgi:type II secretory pathway pseudopilin PulG
MPHRATDIRRRSTGGFSLIEVMVATTVLMIIVLMVAMVFQQSSGAWSGGTRRANSEMTLRSVLGQMQREMIEAVDARDFSNTVSTTYANTFTPDQADFIAILGDPADAVNARVPYHIIYDWDGSFITRTSHKLRFRTGNWQHDGASTVSVLNPSQPLSIFRMKIVPAADTLALPLRVDIEARVDRNDKSLIVSGWSEGHDRVADTADDIVAGAKVNP